MSDTRSNYTIADAVPAGPNPASLRLYSDPMYCAPVWTDVRLVIQQLNMTGSQIADLVGVSSRTVRKWVSSPDTSNHSPIPYAAWRLMLIHARLVDQEI